MRVPSQPRAHTRWRTQVTPLDFITRGVQFVRVSTPMTTADGHRTSYQKLTVRGPPDHDLMASLKSEVQRRDLKSLVNARRIVLGARSQLRPGECETCGEQVPTLLGDGRVITHCGNGMCQLCLLARERVCLPK